MLVRMSPTQALSRWEFVFKGIKNSLPNDPDEALLKDAIAVGRIQVWTVVEEREEGPKILALLTTLIDEDRLVKRSTLWIYTLYTFGTFSDAVWKKVFGGVWGYAKEKECDTILAQTRNRRVIKFIHDLGGDVSFVVAAFNVKDGEAIYGR